MSKSTLSPEEKQMLISEMHILKKTDHPNIIKVFDIFDEKLQIYIVTEYCNGGDLFDRIERLKKLSEESARTIISQLAYALAYCHANKIIHRDIKPENILMQSDDLDSCKIKLIDFGTAIEYNSSKKLQDIYGSSYYIAPEVINGCYDEKCDVWSMGVVAYVLLSGCAPFGGRSDTEIMTQVQKGKFDFSRI
jgi:calcium-dependent protein kinase